MDKAMVDLCNSAVEGENFDWVRDYFKSNPGSVFCFEVGRFLLIYEPISGGSHHHAGSYEQFEKMLPEAVLANLTRAYQKTTIELVREHSWTRSTR